MKNLKRVNQILSLSLLVILFFSCQKSFNAQELPTVTILPSDITSTVVASAVSGFVTDASNAAVKDAIVLIGTNTTVTTDKYGYFEAKNVTVVKNAALVSVSKAGFFKGIKTFIATQNKGAFFRIKLIPKISSGTFNAGTGGAVTLASGLTVSLPANAVVNATSNAAYAGVVTVSAFYINPTAADINSIMPGDLRGLDTEKQLKLLTSYGMAAVELTGASGELLQIAQGKKATLTTPIPSSLLATAPTNLPLWYFNENNGLWTQEGSATKVGNTFVGEVSHFSFWNCDVPNNYIQFNCTVVNTAGQPIQGAVVRITDGNNTANRRSGITDSSGYVAGAIPDNRPLLLEIFSYGGCLTPIYTQNFTTTSSNISLGSIAINTASNNATLVGTILNCNGQPISNGYLIIYSSSNYSRYAISANGTYSINTFLCGGSSTIVNIIGEDVSTGLQNIPFTYTINSGVNNIPNIQACGLTTQQFFNFTIDGVVHNNSTPQDTLGSYQTGASNQIGIYANNSIQGSANYGSIQFYTTNIAQGSSQVFVQFLSQQIPQGSSTNSQLLVNITEYGPIGAYIAGNFSGIITTPAPANVSKNVTCNFRVRRTF